MESRLARASRLHPWVPRSFSCRTSPSEASQLPQHLPEAAEGKQSAQPPVASPRTPTHARRQGYLRAAPLSPGHRGGARKRSPPMPQPLRMPASLQSPSFLAGYGEAKLHFSQEQGSSLSQTRQAAAVVLWNFRQRLSLSVPSLFFL